MGGTCSSSWWRPTVVEPQPAEEAVPAAPLLRPPADVDAVSAGALPGSELGLRPHSRACRIQKVAVLGDASAFRSYVVARGTTTWKDVRHPLDVRHTAPI